MDNSYHWKKGLINAGVIFLGVIIAKVEVQVDSIYSFIFWQHTIISATNITFLAELRYIYAFLNSLTGNGKEPNK